MARSSYWKSWPAKFNKTHETYGTFADAIHLPDDHTLTDADIEAMKQQRFDNWVAHIVEI